MLEPSRRTVLGAGLGLVGLVVIGADQTSADAAAAPVLARRTFTPLVGRIFTTRHAGRSYRVRLTAVKDLPHAARAHREQCFSLLFTPLGRAVLPDGTYRLTRAGRPAQHLFLVHVGTGRTLQAIVNRAH